VKTIQNPPPKKIKIIAKQVSNILKSIPCIPDLIAFINFTIRRGLLDVFYDCPLNLVY